MSIEFDAGQQGFRAGNLDWDADAFSICLIEGAQWSPDQLNDRVLDDVPGAAIASDHVALVNKVADPNGAIDADDPVVTNVAAGVTITGFLIYRDTGDPATSTLVVYNDNTPGFPFELGDVNVIFDNGPDKILN